MKELDMHNKVGADKETKTEVTIKKKQEIEYLLEGTIKPKKDHTIWEINELDLSVKKAQYKIDTVAFNFNVKVQPKKLIHNADCVYISALNETNAKKKYLKDRNQSSYYSKPPILDIKLF